MGRIRPGHLIGAPRRKKYIDRIGKFWDEPQEEGLEAPQSASCQSANAEVSDEAKAYETRQGATTASPTDDEPIQRAMRERGQSNGFKIRFPLADLRTLRKAVASLQRYAHLESVEQAEMEFARLLGVRTYQDAARILTSRHVFLGPGQWTKASGPTYDRPTLPETLPKVCPTDDGSALQLPCRATGVRRHEVIEGMRAEARQIETLRGLAPAKALLEVARDYGFENFDHALKLFPECEVIEELEGSEQSPRRHHLPRKN